MSIYDAIYNKHLGNSTAHGDPTERYESSQPAPGEIKLVEWVTRKARRLRISQRALYARLYRGRHPFPKNMRRANSRLIFVKIK